MPKISKISQSFTKDLENLIIDLGSIVKPEDEKLSKEDKRAFKAISSLRAELSDALVRYHASLPQANPNGILDSTIEMTDTKLIERCKEAILNHHTDIMAAPNIGSRCASSINNFMAKHFAIRPFSMKESAFAVAVKPNLDKVEKFNYYKSIIKNNAEAENRKKILILT